MDLQHTFTVPVDIDSAWTAFTDIERIAPCLPGATITSVDGDTFIGTANVKLGPISMQYHGRGAWVSQDASRYYAVIEAQGKDRRGNGTASATIKAHLEPVPEGTRVRVDTQLKITGRPAQFGRGVIQDVGGKLLDQFASCLAVRLAEQHGSGIPSTPVVASEQTTGVATDASDALSSASPATPSPERFPTNEHAHLDLGGVAGPVLLKRLGPWVAGIVTVAVLIWLVGFRW